jgi:hypothetical protein
MGILLCASLPGSRSVGAGEASTAHEYQRWQREFAATAIAGFWQGVMEPEDERFRRLGPSGGPNLGEFSGLYFTAEGLKKAQAWSPDDDYLPENIGRSQIVPTIMTTPFPIKFEFDKQHVTIRVTECDNVRTVALAESAQQKATGMAPPWWSGPPGYAQVSCGQTARRKAPMQS